MDIRGWLNQAIYVAAMTGVNSYGEPTYGTQAAVQSRCEPKLQKVVNAAGQEVMSDHQVVTLGPIGLQDRVWLPGADPDVPSQGRSPLRAQPAVDKRGRTVFWEAYF